jgi:hypothetical protein
MGKKKLSTILTLAMILSVSVSIMYMSTTNAELTASEKALSFITSVAKIDTTKYNATASNNTVSYPSDLGGLAKVEGGYLLESNGEKTDVTYVFINNILNYFNVYPIKGVPVYSEKAPDNILEYADKILGRYQSYTQFSDVTQMRQALNTITKIENTTTIVGNIKLVVSRLDSVDYTSFQWLYTYNGADYHTGIKLSFKNGSIYTFGDSRYYTIGTTDVKIQSDQAISIAKVRAQNLSWNVNISDTSVTQVSNVTILDDHTNAQLLTAPKEALVLHPYWLVSLTFDKVYPGYVYGVSYSIWADTGEVFYGNLNTLGGPPVSDNPATSSNPTTSTGQYSPTGQIPTTETKPNSENLPTVTSLPMPNSSPVPPSEVKQEPSQLIPSEYGYAIAALIVPIILVASFIIYRRRK